MSSRNVLGVRTILFHRFKTRQEFKWSISGGGLTHILLKNHMKRCQITKYIPYCSLADRNVSLELCRETEVGNISKTSLITKFFFHRIFSKL